MDENVKKHGKRRVFLIIAVVVLVILLCVGLGYCHRVQTGDEKVPAAKLVDAQPDSANPPDKFDVSVDPNVSAGGLETKSEDEIRAELNQKVAASMINISMNTNPVFASGDAEGNLQIVNENINNYGQVVEIYLQTEVVNADGSVSYADGEKVYQSGLVPVGSKILSAKLSKVLPKGEYKAVAYFNAVDDEGSYVGRAGANIRITIES